MTKKLIIALGDSYTEGVGCYEPELLEKFKNSGKPVNWFDEEWSNVYRSSTERFSEYSWPSVLGKKLGYNVINLGEGGSSNSMMAKKFISEEYENLLDDYEKVIVIFLLTVPHRLSFFRQGRPESIMPQDNNVEIKDHLMKNYLEFINFSKEDMWLDNLFYLKAVKNFCKAQNYYFFYGVAWGDDINIINDYYNSSENIHNHVELENKDKINFDYYMTPSEGMRAVCDHPNEVGYEKLANIIANVLKNKFGDII